MKSKSPLLKEFEPTIIRVRVNICREYRDGIEQFALRMLADGRQTVPGLVEMREGEPWLIAGDRRLTAIRDHINPRMEAEGKPAWKFRAEIITGEYDRDLLCLSENVRVELSPIDWGRIINWFLTEKKWTQQQLGAHLHKSQGFVSQHLKVYRCLDDHNRKALHDGSLGFSEALRLSDYSPSQQAAIREPLPPPASPSSSETVQNNTDSERGGENPGNNPPEVKERKDSTRETTIDSTRGGVRTPKVIRETFDSFDKRLKAMVNKFDAEIRKSGGNGEKEKQKRIALKRLGELQILLSHFSLYVHGDMSDRELWGSILECAGDLFLEAGEAK